MENNIEHMHRVADVWLANMGLTTTVDELKVGL